MQYDDGIFTIRIEKTYFNPTKRPWTHIDALVLVNAFPDDPVRSRQLYREQPLELENIDFWAERDGREAGWVVVNDFDSSKELQIVLADDFAHGLKENERTTIAYGFSIERELWGPYFERHIRFPTERLIAR